MIIYWCYKFLGIFFIYSRIWNETWLAGFFYKPCNYELFVKQSLNMEMAIVMARVCAFKFLDEIHQLSQILKTMH